MVSAVIGITKSSLVSVQWIVTVPVALSPGLVPLKEIHKWAFAIVKSEVEGTVSVVPNGVVPKLVPGGPVSTVGPPVIWKCTSSHETQENTAARTVVSPAGTSLKVMVCVSRVTTVG